MKYGKTGEHACGKSYLVRCTGATNQAPQPCKGDEIVVKIVDYCPPSYRGTIDLSEYAFSYIVDPNAGTIKIEYEL
jgi:expansin (peptidoglycan-binding protein)